MSYPQNGGQAASYYNQGQPQYQPQYQQPYQQQQPTGQPYGEPPPQYYGPAKQHEFDPSAGNPTFGQVFKVDKPKYNDLWAGLLFIANLLGFAAVSALAIRGVGKYPSLLPPRCDSLPHLLSLAANHPLQQPRAASSR